MRSTSKGRAGLLRETKEAESKMGLLILTECKPEFSFHYKKLAERVVSHVLDLRKNSRGMLTCRLFLTDDEELLLQMEIYR